MQIIELYTGDDDRTHVRDYTPAEFAEFAKSLVGPVTVPPPHSGPNRPAGFFVDWHTFAMKMCYVMCTGISEYETADGWRRLKPGDVLIFNDPEGQGHRFHITGADSRIALGARWEPQGS